MVGQYLFYRVSIQWFHGISLKFHGGATEFPSRSMEYPGSFVSINPMKAPGSFHAVGRLHVFSREFPLTFMEVPRSFHGD